MLFKHIKLRLNDTVLLMIASLLFLISACGGGGESNSISPASDTGSVSLTLKWQNSPQHPDKIQSPSGDVCTDYAIETVNMIILNSSNDAVAAGSWDCSDHQGTITGVPVGENNVLRIEGIVAENVDWRGESQKFPVSKDQDTDVGTVEMSYISVYPAEVVALIDGQLHRFYRGSPPKDSDWADGGLISGVSNPAGNPVLIQSKFGNKGNFELVYPSSDAEGGIIHIFRDNDDADPPWQVANRFGHDNNLGPVEAVTMIQSDYTSEGSNGEGHLEVVARIGNGLHHFFRRDTENAEWEYGGPITVEGEQVPINDATGNPVMIQSNFGNGENKNYELVYPSTDAEGGIIHIHRDNDGIGLPWWFTKRFGHDLNLGPVEAVTLIQSDFTSEGSNGEGHLEVVARIGNTLHHFFRRDTEDAEWVYGGPITVQGAQEPINDATGIHVLIQSNFGNSANKDFVLVYPTTDAEGGIIHILRDNDSGNPPWVMTHHFGTVDPTKVDAVTIIQSETAGGF